MHCDFTPLDAATRSIQELSATPIPVDSTVPFDLRGRNWSSLSMSQQKQLLALWNSIILIKQRMAREEETGEVHPLPCVLQTGDHFKLSRCGHATV
eukprot:749920-Hanusia_phi.AAC.2